MAAAIDFILERMKPNSLLVRTKTGNLSKRRL
jgi:hypothetical protein